MDPTTNEGNFEETSTPNQMLSSLLPQNSDISTSSTDVRSTAAVSNATLKQLLDSMYPGEWS